MSQNEAQGFFDSCLRVLTLLLPYLLVGLLTSFVDFLQKHLGKDRFNLIKLIVGLVSDMFLAGVIACVGIEIKLGPFGIAALTAICVRRGHEWIAKIVDHRLGIDDERANK